jgi:hypothetical protein
MAIRHEEFDLYETFRDLGGVYKPQIECAETEDADLETLLLLSQMLVQCRTC